MRAAIYLRISSEMQHENFSIDSQRRICAQFCDTRYLSLQIATINPMKTKISLPVIAATIVALFTAAVAIAASPTKAHIENCKHNASGDYVCVSTDNEAPMTIITRVMIDGKPASHQPVTMQLTANAGVASYTCQTATVQAAACRFGQSAAETYSIRVNVVGVEFAWHEGSWR